MLFPALMGIANARGNRKCTALKDEVYPIVLQLVNGTFVLPCAERTTVHRTAIQYFRRNMNRLTIVDGSLYMGTYLALKILLQIESDCNKPL